MLPQILLVALAAPIVGMIGKMVMGEKSTVSGSNEETVFGEEEDTEFYGDAEQTHRRDHITLSEPWLSRVKSGEKTIEIRVGGPDKFKDLIDKELKLFYKGELVSVIVDKVIHEPTLAALVKKVDAVKVLGQKGATPAEVEKIYESFCKPDVVERVGGVVAFFFHKK